MLGEIDLHLFGEGRHEEIYQKLLDDPEVDSVISISLSSSLSGT
jgi:fatty acid-binding protein DegV